MYEPADPLTITSDSVLGWQRTSADGLLPGSRWVENVYLDLLGPDPLSEPLGTDQWAVQKMGLERAWDLGTGEPCSIIAVIDSGIDMGHPELKPRLFTNPNEIAGNGIDDDNNGLVDDVHGWDIVQNDSDPSDVSVGHGTEVAGVAAATVNGIGIAGVAPQATILPIRACSTRCDLFDVAWAVVYAVDSGADVINLSLGGFAEPGPLTDALNYAEDSGVLVVAAAGNSGIDIDGHSFIPAALPNANLISVAATDRDDRLWPSSNTGPAAVDIGAPGVEIVTTTLVSLGQYRTVTGTSYAAPQVAGTAALMLSVDPSLTPAELIEGITHHGLALADLADVTLHGTRVLTDHAVFAAKLGDAHSSPFDYDIVWLAVSGLTKGCNPPANTMFCPDRDVSRAEMATFLQRAFALPGGPDAFTDDNESEFEEAINAIHAAGITKGCNPPANNKYCPDATVSRGEMAAFLTRALNLAPGPDAFTDDNESEFEEAINAIHAAGITKGCNPPANNKYCADATVSRGEMAAFLHRALP